MLPRRDTEFIGLGSFDLDLARVRVLLYETGSGTATAETLHVTRPTVSYSLGELRRRFDDEPSAAPAGPPTPTAGPQRRYEP